MNREKDEIKGKLPWRHTPPHSIPREVMTLIWALKAAREFLGVMSESHIPGTTQSKLYGFLGESLYLLRKLDERWDA